MPQEEADMSPKSSATISNIKIISLLMIISGHYFQGSNNVHLISLSFISVYAICMFMFISGYTNNKEKNRVILKFWIKRFLRLMIPIYTYFLFLQTICLFQNESIINVRELFSILFGLFAFVPVRGGTHLWFITMLLICTLISPLLMKFKKMNSFLVTVTVFVLILIEIYLFLNKMNWVYSEYLLAIFMYVLGFFYKDFLKDRIITKKHGVFLFIFSVITYVLKVKFLSMSATVLYHFEMMFNFYFVSMFIMFFVYIMSKNYNVKLIKYLEKLSYSIYIVQPLVIFGPVFIIYYNASVQNFIQSVFVFILLSILLYSVSNYIFFFIKQNLKIFD